jgi:hypothetical protein
MDAIDFRKGKNGVDINLLAFQTPDCIYYFDSCPTSLGSYSNQGHAWQFKVPDNLKFQATTNLLEFLATVTTPRINIINGRLN